MRGVGSTVIASGCSAERDLEASLEKLRAYRRRDPQLREAIAAFIDAEVTLPDPVEGELRRQKQKQRRRALKWNA
jgi:hypothetical protein